MFLYHLLHYLRLLSHFICSTMSSSLFMTLDRSLCCSTSKIASVVTASFYSSHITHFVFVQWFCLACIKKVIMQNNDESLHEYDGWKSWLPLASSCQRLLISVLDGFAGRHLPLLSLCILCDLWRRWWIYTVSSEFVNMRNGKYEILNCNISGCFSRFLPVHCIVSFCDSSFISMKWDIISFI